MPVAALGFVREKGGGVVDGSKRTKAVALPLGCRQKPRNRGKLLAFGMLAATRRQLGLVDNPAAP